MTVPWGEHLGGAEAVLQAVLEGAGESGEHEIEPIFFQEGGWPWELRRAGFRVEVLPAGRLRQPHRFAAVVMKLARLFRARRPDVILNWTTKTQLYGAPAAMLAGMSGRVVWWQHGIPAGDWMERVATVLPAAAVGCYSRGAARRQAQLRPTRRTFVVAPGSPPPDPSTRPAELDLPDGVPVVGLVGRLQPWKGQDRLMRAQVILRERGQRMHMLIVGGDSHGRSPEYAASLAPLARSLGIGDAVTMTGEVPDAGPYVERMDVLVNASDPEPFGIVLLEGMARGVPVVAVDSGGPAEFIEDGATGVLARSGSPEALAEALEPLLSSSELRARVGSAGRERFDPEYTTAAMRARFFAELETVHRKRAG